MSLFWPLSPAVLWVISFPEEFWKSAQHGSHGFGSSTDSAFNVSPLTLWFAGIILCGLIWTLPDQTVAASLGPSLSRDCWLSNGHPSPENTVLLILFWQVGWFWRSKPCILIHRGPLSLLKPTGVSWQSEKDDTLLSPESPGSCALLGRWPWIHLSFFSLGLLP